MSKRELRPCIISFGFLHAEPPIEADMIIDCAPSKTRTSTRPCAS